MQVDVQIVLAIMARLCIIITGHEHKRMSLESRGYRTYMTPMNLKPEEQTRKVLLGRIKSKYFTVIGYYEETGQVFAYQVPASDPHEAIALACDGDYIDMSCSSDVAVLGAIPGKVDIVAACEDSGKLAYGCDLAQEEEQEEIDSNA